MISLRRVFVGALALVFGGFNSSIALFHLDKYNDTLLTVGIGLLYFVTLASCTVAFRKFALPGYVAISASAIAIAIPILSNSLLKDAGILNGYDTWYVTAVALIFGAIAVRGQIVYAIFGALVFCIEVIAIGGLDYLPKSGLTGAVILIASCIAISKGLQALENEIIIAQRQTQVEGEAAATEAAYSFNVEYATNAVLKKTIPVLKKIASGKNFSKTDRENYAQFEEVTRDEMSGGRLVNSKIKRAVAAARSRGVDIALLDDGGIETTDQAELDDLLDLVADALKEISSGRVTVRTQPKEEWLIRFTASRPGVVTPDLDLKLGSR